MKAKFTRLEPGQSIFSRPSKPIYMSRTQFEDAYYIPSDANIIIVDFKEEEDETQGS